MKNWSHTGKNGQITTNNKHLTVENVCPPYPPDHTHVRWKWSTSKFEIFPPKMATIIHLSYSLEILLKKIQFFGFTNGELHV